MPTVKMYCVFQCGYHNCKWPLLPTGACRPDNKIRFRCRFFSMHRVRRRRQPHTRLTAKNKHTIDDFYHLPAQVRTFVWTGLVWLVPVRSALSWSGLISDCSLILCLLWFAFVWSVPTVIVCLVWFVLVWSVPTGNHLSCLVCVGLVCSHW